MHFVLQVVLALGYGNKAGFRERETMKYDAMDQYGVREHNKRIGNPFTVTRSPQAWARWENTKLAVRLSLFLFVWVPIVAFIAYWFLFALVAVAGE